MDREYRELERNFIIGEEPIKYNNFKRRAGIFHMKPALHRHRSGILNRTSTKIAQEFAWTYTKGFMFNWAFTRTAKDIPLSTASSYWRNSTAWQNAASAATTYMDTNSESRDNSTASGKTGIERTHHTHATCIIGIANRETIAAIRKRKPFRTVATAMIATSFFCAMCIARPGCL